MILRERSGQIQPANAESGTSICYLGDRDVRAANVGYGLPLVLAAAHLNIAEVEAAWVWRAAIPVTGTLRVAELWLGLLSPFPLEVWVLKAIETLPLSLPAACGANITVHVTLPTREGQGVTQTAQDKTPFPTASQVTFGPPGFAKVTVVSGYCR